METMTKELLIHCFNIYHDYWKAPEKTKDYNFGRWEAVKLYIHNALIADKPLYDLIDKWHKDKPKNIKKWLEVNVK